MNADQGIEYVKDMDPVDVGRTNSQKTHMEDTPEISDDSQDKDMEHKKEEHTSNKDKWNKKLSLKNKISDFEIWFILAESELCNKRRSICTLQDPGGPFSPRGP